MVVEEKNSKHERREKETETGSKVILICEIVEERGGGVDAER